MSEPPFEAVVLSDVHIGDNTRTCWYQTSHHEKALKAVLKWIIARQPTVREVILLGDIFDVWTYPPAVQPPSLDQIRAANPGLFDRSGPFADLVKAFPNRVHLMLGNHDGTLSSGDVDLLNPHLGGDVARGEAIQFEPCPIRVIRSGTAATAFSHGHHWCMFNSPDPRSPWAPLPLGHVVSRAIAHKWDRDLPAGKTVADLPGHGNEIVKAGVIKAMKLDGLWSVPRDRPGIRAQLVTRLIAGLYQASGMTPTTPVKLPGGGVTTLQDAEVAFRDRWARWATEREIRDIDADRAAVADFRWEYLAWFAQRLAMQARADLVVFGHTHHAVRHLAKSPVDYVNNGYGCVAAPDSAKVPFTFTVVDLRTGKASVFGADLNTAAIRPVTPDVQTPIVWPGKDYSCYVRLRNDTASRLRLAGSQAVEGDWIVPPPSQIAPGARVDMWLQDKWKEPGAYGTFTYTGAGTSALEFEVACPVASRNRVVSPVDDWSSSSDGERWSTRSVAWGNPLLTRFGVATPLRAAGQQHTTQPDLTHATRYVAVATFSPTIDDEWKRADPRRPPPPSVYNDYALMKVLYPLCLWGTTSTPIDVHAFRYDQPKITPLDFSKLKDSDVIFIAGHGNELGLYAMGPKTSQGVDRLVEILTGDGNLKKLRNGKRITILLLSCRAGLGFHKALAKRLSKALSIETTVGGAEGFTFGSYRTEVSACNEVLVRGIPWIMEYPGSLTMSEAENETSAREGKNITVAAKKAEIEQFKRAKTDLENKMKAIVGQLGSTEVNNALKEINTRFRSQWEDLIRNQFTLYYSAKGSSNLEFDMWFDKGGDGYVWTDAKLTTDEAVSAMLTGNLAPVDANTLMCTR
ncbi:MAG: metallophosphoesterase [Solirubrobacteraceae bacterium]